MRGTNGALYASSTVASSVRGALSAIVSTDRSSETPVIARNCKPIADLGRKKERKKNYKL